MTVITAEVSREAEVCAAERGGGPRLIRQAAPGRHFAVSCAKRVFFCFWPFHPKEGSSFSEDFAFSRQARDGFAKRLALGSCFWASGRGLAKLVSAVSLGKSALISRDPPPAFCGLQGRVREAQIVAPAEASAFFSTSFIVYRLPICVGR